MARECAEAKRGPLAPRSRRRCLCGEGVRTVCCDIEQIFDFEKPGSESGGIEYARGVKTLILLAGGEKGPNLKGPHLGKSGCYPASSQPKSLNKVTN